MTFPCIRTAVTGLALLTIGTGRALAVMTSSAAADGKALLQAHCSRCHSIEAPGTSPLEQAPPLREVYLKYPIAASRHAADSILIRSGFGDPELPRQHYRRRSSDPAAPPCSQRDTAVSFQVLSRADVRIIVAGVDASRAAPMMEFAAAHRTHGTTAITGGLCGTTTGARQ